MTDQKQQAAEKPAFDYIANTVVKRGKKSYWTRIGVAWVHEDGEGFTASLDALPVNGEIVFRKPKAGEQVAEGEQAEATE